ncbi:MAG: amino acid adenylation domain-containing protein, partial [Cyanobacteria bacterium J06598_3]
MASTTSKAISGDVAPRWAASARWAAHSNLTAAQRQLWLGQKLSPESPLYNMAFLFTLSSDFSDTLDVGHFQAAFAVLLQKCDALRMVIEEVESAVGLVPQRRVLSHLDYTVPVLDFSAELRPQEAVRAWGEAQAKRPFVLSQRLFETALIRCGDGCMVWYLNQHHLITDMVALARLYEVMGDLYLRSLSGLLAEAPELPAYDGIVLPAPSSRAVDYWQQQTVPASELYHRGVEPVSSASSRLSCVLSREQTAALKQLAISSEAAALTPQLSLFNLVSGIVLAYLYRVSSHMNGRQQVAFSTPAQGRPSAAFKQTIGVFIELFPLAVEISPEETFASLLTKVSEVSGGLLRYAQPGASEFAPNRDVNVVLNFLTGKVGDFAGLEMTSQWLHSGASDPHHHLRILVHDFDSRGRLQLHFDFNDELFSPDLQDRGPGHFLAMLDAMLADRTQAIAGVDLLDEAEKFRLGKLGQCRQLPIEQTVVQQFEAQVERTPDAIAIIEKSSSEKGNGSDSTLTYRQLNNRANQLAHALQQQGLRAKSPVALCFHRSVDMLVALWAVLKTGCVYVPLDPSHPQARLSHILQESQARWLLTHSTLTDCFAESILGGTVVLPLDSLDVCANAVSNLEQSPQLNDLAYCLYTSGSTGVPKGVEIEHRSLANYVQWAEGQYVRGRVLSFPLFSPLTFDLTVTSIYVPLISGGQVVIYPEDEATIDLSLQRVFQDNAVDVIKLTPSHLAVVRGVVRGAVKGMPMGSRVKVLILGGEDLKTSLAQAIVGDSAIELYNEYGPTEATVGCMVQRFESVADVADAPVSVSIGQPAAGADIYLLDDRLNRVPLGDVGEIFIGGPGLARGYLNRPELTAERFVMREGERLYRTGDLGRWEETGRLSYLGRCDRQVKLHGIRIELGEIEAAISAHPQVSECVVTPMAPSASKTATQLVAYVVPVAGAAPERITAAALRSFLAQSLPSAVRPAFWVALETIPLTANGKVDLAALPSPQIEKARGQTREQTAEESAIAPRTERETTVANVWQQVLRVDALGVDDNFFDLGGDSIMAIQIAARMSEAGFSLSP